MRDQESQDLESQDDELLGSDRRWLLAGGLLLILLALLVLITSGLSTKDDGIAQYEIPTNKPEELKLGKQRMLAAMIPRGKVVWFFKVMGPETPIESVEQEFRRFVTGIQFNESDEPVLADLPEGWQRGGKKRMRFATIYINRPGKQLDLSVSSLPSFGEWDDYVKQNVERWRGQLNLDPSDETWSGGEPMKVAAAQGQSVWVDLIGAEEQATAAPMPSFASAAPISNDLASNDPTTNDQSKSQLDFERPDGWRVGKESSMRLAAFFAGPEDRQAEVTVIPAGGDLRGNVARWMGQVIQGEAKAEDVDQMLANAEKRSVSGREAQRFIILGDAEKGQNSIDATIVPLDGGFSMFIKMTGPAETVQEQSDAMSSFLDSLAF